MNRKELTKLIEEYYGTKPDYPWKDYPSFEVFRHSSNRKWFALIMDVPRSKIGLKGDEPIDIVNFKCDQALIGSLRMSPGFFPAYHMNKQFWVTAALDGSASNDDICMVLDISYELTAPKVKKNKKI